MRVTINPAMSPPKVEDTKTFTSEQGEVPKVPAAHILVTQQTQKTSLGSEAQANLNKAFLVARSFPLLELGERTRASSDPTVRSLAIRKNQLIASGVKVSVTETQSSGVSWRNSKNQEVPADRPMSGITSATVGIATNPIFSADVSYIHELTHLAMLNKGSRPANTQAEEAVATYLSLRLDPNQQINADRALNIAVNRGQQASNFNKGNISTVVARLRGNGIDIPNDLIQSLLKQWGG